MSISSEINRISGNVSDAFDAVDAMGGTVPTGATSDNLAASIQSIPQGSGTSLPSVDSTDNGSVLKVSNGEWNKGKQSWNDLTDKPFSEETITIEKHEYDQTQGIEITITNLYAINYNGRMYRVHDYVDPAYVAGCSYTASVFYVGHEEDKETSTFTASVSGSSSGWYILKGADSVPAILFVENDNTNVKYSAAGTVVLDITVETAGTYFFYLVSDDGEYSSVYYPETITLLPMVHKLDEKFYDKGLPTFTSADNGKGLFVRNGNIVAENDFYILTTSADLAGLLDEVEALAPGESTESFFRLDSGSYAEAKQAYDNGKRVILRLSLTRNDAVVMITEIPLNIVDVNSRSLSTSRFEFNGIALEYTVHAKDGGGRDLDRELSKTKSPLFKINITTNYVDGNIVVSGDKTYTDIEAAATSNNYFVFASLLGAVLTITNIRSGTISFGAVTRNNSGLSYAEITVNDQDEWTLNQYNT